MATRKKPTADLPAQSDPRAPLDGSALLARTQSLLTELEADLLVRARASVAVREAIRLRHVAEKAARRTADPLEVWERHFVTQVAASWVLSCVFVRTLEDRGLLGHARIAGPGAADSQRMFFELAPSLTEREYLLTTFRELTRLPAARDLFDARHNPVWLLGPSAEMAKKLVALFRAPNAEAPGLRFGQADTRFLGDLYQDLSADVRERFALLQTPHFVEKYILDRTLERAIQRFGLDQTTLIDPTCGSGHFLLGAFERLLDHRMRNEPGLEVREAARRALDAVYGADINPYAVAIARFRLTLAFLDKARYARLGDAPVLPLHVVVADSLLHAAQQGSLGDVAGQSKGEWEGAEFALEDEAAAKDVLLRRYAAVVGNPPYITVKDAVLRERYRELYPRSAAGKYSVAAPFTERFFLLAKTGGCVGMITANSFMKREFGKKLIEEFLPTVNLDGVVNTSGAYIPGHGTPTVLLFGTNEAKVGADVLTVLAKRGEPSTPSDPEQGFVWRSIADHGAEVGFENDYMSVARVARPTLEKHPWSLGGGGAAELKELLEERADAHRLGDLTESIGFMSISGEDDAFLASSPVFERHGLPHRGFGVGEDVRDWSHVASDHILFPYDDAWRPAANPAVTRWLWPFRTNLRRRLMFGKTHEQAGFEWFEYRHVGREKIKTPLSIAFAFVATHNHFVLDRGGKVFNRTGPIIKLKEGTTEEDHLALLAYLNSSTACFWMKQAMMNKGGSGIGRGVQDEAWESRFEFDGTKLATVPLPKVRELLPLVRTMLEQTEQRASCTPAVRIARYTPGKDVPLATDLEVCRCEFDGRLACMVGLQEELDWRIYEAFGLLPAEDIALLVKARGEALGGTPDQLKMRPASVHRHGLHAGHRPFEIALAREHLTHGTKTAWFVRNGYRSPSEITDSYSPAYQRLLEARLAVIDRNPTIRLLEQPEYKRRWTLRDYDAETRDAATSFVVDALEQRLRTEVEPRRARSIASTVFAAPKTAEVLASLASADPLLFFAADAVPFLAALRHTDSGLEKRAAWERVWELQRAEDRGEQAPPFDPAPKYDQADYREPTFWRLRGKLDVPKERFISYPGCESDEDKEPIYGWAGWNHLQQAQALAALYQKRKVDEAWGKDRLTPMLAGILELIPWVKQWHNEPSQEFDGLKLGDYFESFLDAECLALGLTRDDLRAWRPAEKTRGRAAAAKRKAPASEAGEENGEAAPIPAKRARGRKRAAPDAPAEGE